MDEITPPPRVLAPEAPDDNADISDPFDPVTPPPALQPAIVQRRAGAPSVNRGRLSRFMQEVRECARDLAVLYAGYFFTVLVVALLQHALRGWSAH
jgi:hypothetical protein